MLKNQPYVFFIYVYLQFSYFTEVERTGAVESDLAFGPRVPGSSLLRVAVRCGRELVTVSQLNLRSICMHVCICMKQ